MISKDFDEKRVDDIFVLITGDIVALNNSEATKVNAIVNAAKPTLMGGSGVDGAIHSRIDELLRGVSGSISQTSGAVSNEQEKCCKNKFRIGNRWRGKSAWEEDQEAKKPETFNEKIKRCLHEPPDSPDNKIRCKPGHAVLTEGQEGFVDYVIHAVGSKYDGGSEYIRTLQNCYEEVMRIVFDEPGIKRVAIPVISSGNFGVQFDLALRVAIATIANSLIKEKQVNYDSFAKVEKVYLVIYEEKHHIMAKEIYAEFDRQIKEEKHMIYMNSRDWQKAYCNEIWKYDSVKRNYFTITKIFRWFLAAIRFLFPFSLLIQEMSGRISWRKRKEVVEIETMLKALAPVVAAVFIQVLQLIPNQWLDHRKWILYVLCSLIAYIMLDTITYLMSLIFLVDIVGPSANRLRTIILLIFNYMEMILGIALFYYVHYWGEINIFQALDYSVLGKTLYQTEKMTFVLRAIEYSREGIKFFFLVVTFAFFLSHLKQREFLEN